MLKKKTVLLLIPFGVVLFLFSLVLQKYPSLLIRATAKNYLVVNDEHQYEMPLNIFVCYYDCQRDEAYIPTDDYYYPDGVAHQETKEWFPNHFKIENQNDLNSLKSRLRFYRFEYEQDSYMNHGEDECLPAYFLISTNSITDFPYDSESVIGNTVSSVKNSNKIKDIILPNFDEEFELTIKASDDTSPVINGYEGVYITSVDSPDSVDTIKAQLSAYDDVDGDVTSRIIIKTDNYTANKNKIGVYSLEFEVSDKSNNKACITIKVSVVDNIKPTISGPNSITSYLSSPATLESITAQMSANDNYDSNITNSITVYADTFSSNSGKVGEYSITYKVVDSSNNYTTKTVIVKSIDDIKPMISGPSSYTKTTNTSLISSTIINSLSANDNIDGDLTNSITEKTNNYIGNENKVGTYTITYTVKDSSNNVSDIFTVTIVVEDKQPPVFYISNNIINITIYDTLSHEDIINYLCSTAQIDSNREYTCTFVSDEYIGNENTEGLYNVLTKVNYNDGEEQTIKLSIKVNSKSGSSNISENTNQSNITNPIEKVSVFSKIWTWIKVKINAVINFFTGIWQNLFSK